MKTLATVLVTLAGILLATAAHADVGAQVLKLLPEDGAAEDGFGWSVDAASDVIVVGSYKDDDNGSASGSAYLFDATTGAQLLKLVAADGAAGDQFGCSVAIEGDTIVVGARWDDDNGDESGSAYLFDAITGEQLAKLTPEDGTPGADFGTAVAIDGGIVVVGAKYADDNGSNSGSAYLFDAATGAQLHKLLPDDGAVNDNFGGAVAIDDGIVAIGAHGKWNAAMPLAGAAYVFDAATGDELHKLLPDDAAWSDFFGSAIDIDNGIVVVGAWAKNIYFDHSGAAYLFDASSGSQIGPRLEPADTADRDNFGSAVAIQDDLVALSAPGDSDTFYEAGSAYLYSAPDGDELMELYADDAAALYNLGSGIALAGGLLVVGAERDDDNGPNSGSAYVFGVAETVPGDLNGDGAVNGSDLGLLLAEWGPCDDCSADLNLDGTVDGIDLGMLLGNWGASA